MSCTSGVLEHPEQSPGSEPVEEPLAGSLSLLQHHGSSCHQVMSAVMRVVNAVSFLEEGSANGSAHLAEIATGSTLSELR